jgi:hypothetical protein
VRLSEWRMGAPVPGAASDKVLGVVEAALGVLGVAGDADCWVSWGEEPANRWSLMAVTEAGLAVVVVRVNVPQEGPRASGRLVRWSRVQVGEFAVEMQGGHRFVSASVEGTILRGVDEEADNIGLFLQGLFGAIDGRSSDPRAAVG